MERAAANVIRILEDNKSKFIEKLKKLYHGYIKELNKCYTELDDLDIILTSYTNEMQAIIKPIYPNRFVRVDRNDIYFNKQSIITACQSVNFLVMNRGRNTLSYSSSFGKSEEEKYREEQNYRKLEEIWRDLFPRYGRKLNVHVEALNSIYKRKIVPFENKDDEFKARAGKLYYRYSNSWEIFRTDLKADIKVVADLVGGVFNALWDLVKGILVLAKGIISYAASSVVLAVTYPFNVKPRWAKEIFNGTNTAIGAILKNPMLIVEGISQQISDTFEEKGAAYCIGYAAGDFLGGKGLDKLAKVGKAKILSKSDIADNIGDAAKVIDKIDDTAKAADNIGDVVSKTDSIIGKIDEVDIPKITDEVIEGGSKAANLWRKSTCNNDELYNYLLKNVNSDVANKFLKEGKWPDGIQIPKNSSVLNPDGSINWSKAAEGGYTLNIDGTAKKENFIPEIGGVIDRYGNANGRYTSPVINGKSYSYTERSLPYVEDLSNYHQYEVVGDFSKLEEYINNCSDIKLKTQIDAAVTKYYDGDYSKLISYKGEIAEIKGWGTGGGIQYEFSLTVDQLEGLKLLKEIK